MKIRKDDDENAKGGSFVIALSRGLDVLRCFDAFQPELAPLEIAKLTGLPQPTVWRLCNTLVERGCLVRHASTGKLSVGLGLLGFGYAGLPSVDLGELSDREMQHLADELNAGVSLSIPGELEMIIIKRVRGSKGRLSGGVIGAHIPMSISAAGWAYLSTLSSEEFNGMTEALKRQAGEISGALEQPGKRNWSQLRKIIDAEIARCQTQGFVINAGIYMREINYACVPIATPSGVYTLHCSALASVLPISRLEKEVGPRLVALADRMRVGLGRSGEMF